MKSIQVYDGDGVERVDPIEPDFIVGEVVEQELQAPVRPKRRIVINVIGIWCLAAACALLGYEVSQINAYSRGYYAGYHPAIATTAGTIIALAFFMVVTAMCCSDDSDTPTNHPGP